MSNTHLKPTPCYTNDWKDTVHPESLEDTFLKMLEHTSINLTCEDWLHIRGWLDSKVYMELKNRPSGGPVHSAPQSGQDFVASLLISKNSNLSKWLGI